MTIRIRRCRVAGLATTTGAVAPPASIAPLVRHLERTTWPEDDGRCLVILRQVSIVTTSAGLDGAMSRALAAAVREAVPVHPGRPVPDQVPGVRFADPGLRLAAFAADVAHDQAARRWWWRTAGWPVDVPPATAIATAWSAEPAWLPAAIAHLDAAGCLAPVWQRLDGPAAEGILNALVRHHGWSTALLRPLAVGLPGPASRAGPAAHPGGPGPAPGPWPARQRQRWQGILAHREPDHPVARLAVVLAALESAPRCLVEDPAGAGDLAAWSLGAWPEARSLVVRGRAQAGGGPSEDDPPTAITVRLGARSPRPVDPPHPDPTPVPRSRAALPATGPTASGARPPAAAHPPPALAQVPAGLSHPRITTSFAGCLCLLNVSRHPSLRPFVDRLLAGRLHGWRLWLDLAHHLGLPIDDPLARFLAGMVAELPEVEPADPAALVDLSARAAGVHGEAWGPDLLRAVGTVVVSPTHVDACLPLTAVRLDVRRAGLDLDPGWVPWLGRVVAIRFIPGPSAAAP